MEKEFDFNEFLNTQERIFINFNSKAELEMFIACMDEMSIDVYLSSDVNFMQLPACVTIDEDFDLWICPLGEANITGIPDYEVFYNFEEIQDLIHF